MISSARPRRIALTIEPYVPIANVHPADASVVGVDELGALGLVATYLEPRLQILTHARNPLPVGEYLRLAPCWTVRNTVLPTVSSGAGDDSRDIELLAERKL